MSQPTLEELLAAFKADPSAETLLALTEALGAYYREAHGLGAGR